MPDIAIDLECRESSFNDSSSDDDAGASTDRRKHSQSRKKQKTFHQLERIDGGDEVFTEE